MKIPKKPLKPKNKKTIAGSSKLMKINKRQERGRAEESLRDDEERFRSIFEEGPLGMALVDLDFHFTKVNAVFCKMLGYSKRELLSMTFKDITHADHVAENVQSIKKLIKGKLPVYRTEKRYIRKNRQIIWGTLTVTVIRSKNKQFQYMLAMIEDITERKRTENVIKEAELKFRTIFDFASDGILLARPDDRLLTIANGKICKMLGYTEEELLKLSYTDIHPKESLPYVIDQFEKLLGGKILIAHDIPVMRKDGNVFFTDVSGSVITFEGEKYLLGLFRDMTERKQAEEEIHQKEEQFRSLFMSMSQGFYLSEIIYDTQGNPCDYRYLEVNPQFEQILGLKRDQIIGKRYRELVPVDTTQWLDFYCKVAQTGTPLTYEFYSNEYHKYFETYSYKPTKGQVSVLVLDITERKLIEESVKEKDKQFKELFENAPVGYHEIDRQGNIINVNQTELKMLGYSFDEMIGWPVWEYAADKQESQTRVLGKLRGVLPPNKNTEQVYTHRDGTTMPVIADDSLLKNDHGEIIGIRTTILDITKRKLAENALHESQALYQSFVEHIPAGVFRKDSTGRYIFVNSYFCQLKGLKADEILGKTSHELAAYESAIENSRTYEMMGTQRTLEEQGTDHHKLIMLTGKPIELEETYPQPDGTTQYFQVVKSPVFSFDGKIIGTQGIQFDITDRKRAEQDLQRSEIKYREMVEQINDVIFSADVHGIYTYISPAAENMSGYKPEEMIGHPMEEFLDPMFISKYKQQVQKIMSGILEPSEYRIKIKSGEYRWIRSSSKPIFDGDKLIGIRGVLTDITERKKAEETVNLLSHTIKSIGECISVTDLHNNIIYVNQAFLDTYGFAEEEVLGKNISDIVYTKGSDKQEILAATLRGEWHGERINLKKDGTEFPIHLSTSTVHDELGDPIALVGAATDISEQKKLQQELLQSQKMQSIGTLAGGIAHDFNNILGIILGYASLLERQKLEDSKHAESISAIYQAVHRGAALVRQILTFARKTDVEFEVINVNDLVHELICMLQQTFPKIITFNEIIEKHIPYIQADRTQIHQALLNLCVNARDAMPNGGSLIIRTEIVTQEQIQEIFPTADQNAYVRISVTDTGEGMDEATRLRIFDPFFTTKEKGKGTGLGLSVTYGVMQTHNGFIHVESELEQGSTFQLYFPAPDPNEKFIDSQTTSDSFTVGGTETILIVEDEELLIDMVHLLLEANGYKVYAAHNGLEAIEVYKEHNKEIDLVLSDMGLPGMTGAEVFKKLKEINPDVKVTLASGFIDPDVKSELFKAGAKGFIQKPYSPDEVLRKLREVLEEKIERTN